MDVYIDSIASSTPETTASVIVNLFSNEVNKQDVNGLLNVQNQLLEKLDKTNEKLEGVNKISAERLIDATREFSNHTQMLITMKNDLDLIFKRIKLLQMRLNKKYPDSFASIIQETADQHGSLDDEEDDGLTSSIKSLNNSLLVKSKTVDCSELPPSIRETYSLAQINDNTNSDQLPSSFDAVRRFVLNRSSGAQDITAFFKNARDEIKKLNEGFLGGNPPKLSTSHEE